MFRSAAAMMATVVIAACGTATPDAPGPGAGAGPGWRKGLVLQVGDSSSLGPAIDSDCREHQRADANPARRYVEVQYFVGRHAHLRIVPIEDALRVAVGDPVFFRSFGCAAARTVGPSSE